MSMFRAGSGGAAVAGSDSVPATARQHGAKGEGRARSDSPGCRLTSLQCQPRTTAPSGQAKRLAGLLQCTLYSKGMRLIQGNAAYHIMVSSARSDGILRANDVRCPRRSIRGQRAVRGGVSEEAPGPRPALQAYWVRALPSGARRKARLCSHPCLSPGVGNRLHLLEQAHLPCRLGGAEAVRELLRGNAGGSSWPPGFRPSCFARCRPCRDFEDAEHRHRIWSSPALRPHRRRGRR